MKFWKNTSKEAEEEPEDECATKSERFYYDSGDTNQLQLFKGLSRNINKTLRSLYLERCILDADVLVSSIRGCEVLTSIKLYEVSIKHASYDPAKDNLQELVLPNLETLHVHDLSEDTMIVMSKPFDKVEDARELKKQEKFAQYHVEFYFQFLASHLDVNECKSLLCKFHSFNIDFSIKLRGYQILKYSPLEKYEKLVASPLLTCYSGHCSNRSHQLFSQIKYLSCSDQHLTLPTTPKNLEEVNLYISKTSSLVVDLTISQKLSSVRSLTLHLKTAAIIDLKILSSGLGKLEELVIINAIIHSTATSPLKVSSCCFDQCTFSEAFMKNVSRFLNCQHIALDVQPVRNWNGVFKSNIMSMSAVRRIFVWSVEWDGMEDKITFSEIFEKKPSPAPNVPLVWQPKEFENVETRRYILLNHRDFYPPLKNIQPYLFKFNDEKLPSSSPLVPTCGAYTLFATFVAIAAIIYFIYSGLLKKA